MLIALIFPLFVSPRPTWRVVTAGVLLGVAWLFPRESLITTYLPLFLLGTGAFQLATGISRRMEVLVVSVAACCVLCTSRGLFAMVAAAVTAVIIVAIPRWTNPTLAFLGTVSYSLYLLHVPIGGRIVNLADRLHPSPLLAILAIAVAGAVSIGAAWVLWYFVERPAQRYVSRPRFENCGVAAMGEGSPALRL